MDGPTLSDVIFVEVRVLGEGLWILWQCAGVHGTPCLTLETLPSPSVSLASHRRVTAALAVVMRQANFAFGAWLVSPNAISHHIS